MPYTVFLVNIDNPDAKSLMMKLHKEGKPGHFVRCTEAEIRAYCVEDGLIPIVIQEREQDIPQLWAVPADAQALISSSDAKELLNDHLAGLAPVTIIEYTTYEGGPWKPWPANGLLNAPAITVHAIRLNNGREWDTVNGWRTP